MVDESSCLAQFWLANTVFNTRKQGSNVSDVFLSDGAQYTCHISSANTNVVVCSTVMYGRARRINGSEWDSMICKDTKRVDVIVRNRR